MSLNDFDTIVYKSIISCPVGNSPYIPFKTISDSGEDKNSRYGLTSSPLNSSLSPYSTVGDRAFWAFEVVDLNPSEKSTLDENLEKIEDFERESLEKAGIPHLAFIYLTLTESNPTIPELLDAWVDEKHNQEIVIISNYQSSQYLEEYWEDNDTPLGQILDYFQQMLKLWRLLSKIDCASTLLHRENLRVNLDGSLVINKIYLNSGKDSPSLANLVETWGDLLSCFEGKYDAFISDLMVKIESGEIEEVKELKSELESYDEQMELDSMLKENEDLDIFPDEEILESVGDDFDEDDDSELEATRINSEGDDQPTVVLPMRLLSVKEVGMTDIGRSRGHNEDYFLMDTKIRRQESSKGTTVMAKGLFIVCDGMGGHSAGEVASATAVKSLANFFQKHWGDELPDAETIKKGVWETNQAIYSLNRQKGEVGSGRMGTTMVLVLLHDTKIAIAHVGDSRIYRVNRKWGIEKLTVDHCVAQAEIKQGIPQEMAFSRPDAYQLTQALGPRDNSFVRPDINFLDIKEDTLLILCSDGLYENDLLENNCEKLLLPLISAKANLEEGIAQIIDLGNQVNGHDNLTCVLVRIKVQPNLDGQNSVF